MPRGRPPKSKQAEAEQSEPDAEMEAESDPAQNAAANDEPTRRSGRARKPNMRYSGDFITDFKAPLPEPEPAAAVATEPGKRGRKSKKASLDGENEVKVEEPEQQEEGDVKPEKQFKTPSKRKSTEKKQKEKKKQVVEETPPPVLDREWSPDDDVPILNKKKKADEPVSESRESSPSSSSSSSSSLSSSPSPSPSPVQKREVDEEPAEYSPAPVVEKLEKTSSAHREESVENNRHKSPEPEPKRHRPKRPRVVIPFDDDTSEDWAPPEKRAPKERLLSTPKAADVTPSHPSTSRDLRNDIAMSVKEKKRHSISSTMTPPAPFKPKPPSSASSSRPIINPTPVKQTITEMWAQKFQELKKNRAPAGSEVAQSKPVQGSNDFAEVAPAAQKETTSGKLEGEKKQVLKKQRSAASSTTLPSPTAAKASTDNLLDAIIDNQTQLINLEAKKQREQELEELKRKNAAIYGNQTASTSASMLGRPPPSVPSYQPASANHLPVRVPPPPPPKPKNLSVPPPPPKKPATTQSAAAQWVKPPSSATATALPPPPPPKKPPPPSQPSGSSSTNQSNAVSSSSAPSSTDVPKPVNNASKLPIPPPPPPKKKPEQTVAQQQVVSTTTSAAPEQAKTSEKRDDIPPPPAPRQSSTEPEKQERRTRISRWDIMVPKQVLMAAAASSNSPLPQFTIPPPSIPVSVPAPVPPPFVANSVTSPAPRPASPIDPLVIARSTSSPLPASLILPPPPPPPPVVGGTEQETQEEKKTMTSSPEKAKDVEQEARTESVQMYEIAEYGPEPPPQAEELQKETIQLGQEQNRDKETEEAIESEGGGEKQQQQQESGDGLPRALSSDRRLSIKERLKQMQMMDDNQEEEYDPLAVMSQKQLGEEANESVLSAYVPSAVDANATRLTSIDDSVDEDEVIGEQEAEDEMEYEEDDEEDIEEEEQKEEFDEDESVESSKDAESTDKERQTDDDSQQGKENEDNVVDPKTLNPLELLSKAKDVLTELTIEEESTQQPEAETQGPYSQVHLDREEVDTPEPTEKELPEFHGEPVPDDDEYLFQVAAGIKPTKKKKDLVIEEEDLPSEENIEPDYYNADLHIKGTTNKAWLLEPENADGLALMWGGVRSNFAVKTPLVHPIKSESTTEDGGESSDKHKIGFQIKILEKLPLKHLPFEETDPYDVRVGFSTADTPTILGEYATSYCYTATAKKGNNSIFLDYGETFDQDDVITAVFDLVSGEMIFYKNGVCLDLSFTHQFSEQEQLFFPHVCTKNCKIAINYGDNPEGEHLWPIPEGCNFTFFNQIDRRNLMRTKMPPDDKSKCTLLMMVGLPGVGKTTWVKQYLRDHDDEHWIHICAENVLQAMRVNGKSRRTVKNIRWDMVLGLVGKSLQRLVQLAARRRHNYILDMSNTARETRKRRLSLFTGFQKKCLVLMPSEEEMKERQARQARAEGMPIIPTEAMLEMKAILSLPSSDEEPIDWVHFIEPPMERINEVIAMVAQFNSEGRPWYQKKYRKKWRAHRNSFGGSIVPASAPGPSSGPHSFTHTSSHAPHQQYQHRPQQHFNQNQNQEPRLLPLSRQSSNYPNLHVVITDLDSPSGQPMPLSSSGYSGGYSRSSTESTPQHTPGLNSVLAKFSACPFKP